MTCQSNGIPRPKITWFKDNNVVTGSRFTLFANGSLRIVGFVRGDGGVYMCRASNAAGFAKKSKTLTIQGWFFLLLKTVYCTAHCIDCYLRIFSALPLLIKNHLHLQFHQMHHCSYLSILYHQRQSSCHGNQGSMATPQF